MIRRHFPSIIVGFTMATLSCVKVSGRDYEIEIARALACADHQKASLERNHWNGS
jgi:hypothetical protein